MRIRPSQFTLLASIVFATACGSDVTVYERDPGDASGGSGSSQSSGNGALPRQPNMDVRAPTRFSIEIEFNTAPPPEALDASRYSIDGDYGGLVIESIAAGDKGGVVTLTTNQQKLGVHYHLTFAGPDAWRLEDTFPSADTAQFWATDLSHPNFPEYQITADRKAIGTRSVVYVEQGWPVNNANETASFFDEDIYVPETTMFNDPPDRDDNDRILLLGLNGKNAYGGYFNSIDTLTNEEALATWGYHSNEMEMLYINVEYGAFDNRHVVAHEFSHLLYEERHKDDWGWAWHNEGMAECAVHVVNGNNNTDVAYYVQDPSGGIRNGISLINWEYGNFDQYVLAYMFLTYAASQKDGVATYGELFGLDSTTFAFEDWLLENLGITFDEAHKRQLLATWVQAPSGPYGYNGMVSFPGTAPVSTEPLTLEPFSGAFRQPSSPVSYPGTQGPDIIYVGVNGLGEIDEVEPFDASGGALLVFNTSTNVNNLTPQPSGNPIPQLGGQAAHDHALGKVAERTRQLTWLHPPPFNPRRLDELRAWQRVAHAR